MSIISARSGNQSFFFDVYVMKAHKCSIPHPLLRTVLSVCVLAVTLPSIGSNQKHINDTLAMKFDLIWINNKHVSAKCWARLGTIDEAQDPSGKISINTHTLWAYY